MPVVSAGIDENLVRLLSELGKLLVAYVLALPIGLDREVRSRSAGLRTFPLVSLASCCFVMLALSTFEGAPDATSRVLEGMITGIGFIGAGAILKTRQVVFGTATAASIWITGAIGAATALERLDLAIALGVLTWLTFRVADRVKRELPIEDERAREP